MGRKSYDRQFKIAAVKLILEENMSVSKVHLLIENAPEISISKIKATLS